MVSEEVTTKGIGKHLKCSISYASFLINKFEREGLVNRSKAKIILYNRAQDSVFLTENGLKLAKELEASINKKQKLTKQDYT